MRSLAIRGGVPDEEALKGTLASFVKALRAKEAYSAREKLTADFRVLGTGCANGQMAAIQWLRTSGQSIGEMTDFSVLDLSRLPSPLLEPLTGRAWRDEESCVLCTVQIDQRPVVWGVALRKVRRTFRLVAMFDPLQLIDGVCAFSEALEREQGSDDIGDPTVLL